MHCRPADDVEKVLSVLPPAISQTLEITAFSFPCSSLSFFKVLAVLGVEHRRYSRF